MEQLKLALDPPKITDNPCLDDGLEAYQRPVLHCRGCNYDLTPGDVELRVNRTYSYTGYEYDSPRLEMSSDSDEWDDDVESWHCARCGAEIELPEGTEIQWT